jgi:hypothetical protein
MSRRARRHGPHRGDRIHAHAAEIGAAYEEKDKDRSVQLWQGIFGDGFAAPAQRARRVMILPPTPLHAAPEPAAGKRRRRGKRAPHLTPCRSMSGRAAPASGRPSSQGKRSGSNPVPPRAR